MAVGDFFYQELLGGGTIDLSQTDTGAVEIHTIQGSSPAKVYREYTSTPIEYDVFGFKGVGFGDSENRRGTEHFSYRLTTGDFTNPTDVEVGDNGNRLYIVGTSKDSVREYQLSTPNDISTAYFPRFKPAEPNPEGVTFNDDGTKLYITGTSNDKIREYTLSTPYKFADAEFSHAIDAQDNSPTDLRFNDDGTRLYELGRSSDSVFQYDLGTAYDLSTAVYDGDSVSVQSSESNPYAFDFSNDGSSFFVVGSSSDTVYEFTMSVDFNVVTASASGTEFNVSSQATDPRGFRFNNDGTKFYIVDEDDDDIFEYDLGTAFDISSATYNGVNVSTFTGQPAGMEFNDDGTQLLLANTTQDDIRQFNLGTGFDLSTAVEAQQYKLPMGSPYGLYFSNDGTRFFAIDDGGNDIRQFDLSTPWSVETASDGTEINSQDGQPEGLTFNDDGTLMFEIGKNNDRVREWVLETPFDLDGAQRGESYYIGDSSGGNPSELLFNDDGTVLYITNLTGDDIAMYRLKTPYDIRTIYFVSKSDEQYSSGPTPEGFCFGSDGTTYYEIDASRDDIIQFGPANYRTTIDQFNQGFHSQQNKIELVDGQNEITIESEGIVEVTGIEVPN